MLYKEWGPACMPGTDSRNCLRDLHDHTSVDCSALRTLALRGMSCFVLFPFSWMWAYTQHGLRRACAAASAIIRSCIFRTEVPGHYFPAAAACHAEHTEGMEPVLAHISAPCTFQTGFVQCHSRFMDVEAGMTGATKPVLSYWEKAPPLAAVAAASLAGIELDAKPDPKATKDSPPLLTLPAG